mmetsp:Transcript_82445/g.163608  ORF Transcript_82445/g.163608 Transcript_82445/m.163608 type:complete len:90 (-) Transcript_82445:655-924(-)
MELRRRRLLLSCLALVPVPSKLFPNAFGRRPAQASSSSFNIPAGGTGCGGVLGVQNKSWPSSSHREDGTGVHIGDIPRLRHFGDWGGDC